MVQALAKRGIRAGVISRGYRGAIGRTPRAVTAGSDPTVVGDEPVLIASRCACPVVVHPDRVAAGKVLLAQGVDVVIADDGLQHYALARDYEVLVVDGNRGFGNGFLLPAGPLRESPARVSRVDRILVNGGAAEGLPSLPPSVPQQRFELVATSATSLDGGRVRALTEMAGSRVHAVAGIGNPQRFFSTLTALGIEVEAHPHPDHASIAAPDLRFADGSPALITEKDAVKCRGIDVDDVWYVPVDVQMADDGWIQEIETLIRERRH